MALLLLSCVRLTGLQSYIRLMEDCWAKDPASRPHFEVIARRIEAMQQLKPPQPEVVQVPGGSTSLAPEVLTQPPAAAAAPSSPGPRAGRYSSSSSEQSDVLLDTPTAQGEGGLKSFASKVLLEERELNPCPAQAPCQQFGAGNRGNSQAQQQGHNVNLRAGSSTSPHTTSVIVAQVPMLPPVSSSAHSTDVAVDDPTAPAAQLAAGAAALEVLQPTMSAQQREVLHLARQPVIADAMHQLLVDDTAQRAVDGPMQQLAVANSAQQLAVSGAADQLAVADVAQQLGIAGTVSGAAQQLVVDITQQLPNADMAQQPAVDDTAQQLVVADLTQQLAAGAAAVELLQPTLPGPLQQLLLLWAVLIAREAAVGLAGHGGDAAACTSNGTPPGVHMLAASDSSRAISAAAAAAAVDLLSRLQHAAEGHHVSIWGLLWLQLQLVRSCQRLQQLLQQGTAPSAVAVQESSVGQQRLLLAAATAAALLFALAWLVYAAGSGRGKLLQVHQLVTAAVLVLLALHLWRFRPSHNRPTQQRPGPNTQSRLEGSTQQQGFAVFSCCADVPGHLWVNRLPDAAASTLCYSAFACSEAAGAVGPIAAGTEPAAPPQSEQPQAGLLLCVLPQPYCEQLGGQLQQSHFAAAGNTSDIAPARDQGSSQQHITEQNSSLACAAAQPTSCHVLLQQHPVLSWCGFGEDLKPGAALRGALQPLQAALHQQQRAVQRGEARWLLVPISWVCLDPPMMLQGAPSGSSLASWLIEQQQQQQQQQHHGSASTGRFCSLQQQQQQPNQHQQPQQQVQAEWTPPFPVAEWPQVLGWLLDVVAAIQLLHQHGVTHAGMHAGTVHLVSSQGEGLQAQLSLAEPWFRGVTVVPAVDPALSAPETIGLALVERGSSSSSSRDPPAANTSDYRSCTDVYGVGMLMWQLATGWVPQQAEGPAEAQAEVSWCADWRDRYGATFPGAADAVAARYGHWEDAWGRCSNAATTVRKSGSGAAAGGQDARHGRLPSTADSWLPEGYRALMYRCCQPQASTRPDVGQVTAEIGSMKMRVGVMQSNPGLDQLMQQLGQAKVGHAS